MAPKKQHCKQDTARRANYQKKMFKDKKLTLVLDLDETLLHSIYLKQVDPTYEAILRKKEKVDKNAPNGDFFWFVSLGCWTKLRPGVRNFLVEASKLFELHVNTMAGQIYGTRMVKALDPTGKIFDKRVIFNGDAKETLFKKLDGVMGLESAVLIVDDNVDIWPQHQPNLINVKKYTYLQDKMSSGGNSSLDIDSFEKREGDTLASLLKFLKRIHHNFFAHPKLEESDVRNILATERSKD